MPPSRLPRRPAGEAFGLCALNWLVPGSGYILCGDAARGATLFVLLNACWLAGLAFGGYIAPPGSWNPRHESFNIVASLQYIAQGFHGLGWIGLQWLHRAASADREAFFNLHRLAIKPFSDLGCFHMVVAGGLNYFATVRLWDLLAGTPELTESHHEAKQEGASA